MSYKKIPPHYHPLIELVALGYRYQAIAKETGLKYNTIVTYAKLLREEYFNQEEEFANPSISPENALMFACQKYMENNGGKTFRYIYNPCSRYSQILVTAIYHIQEIQRLLDVHTSEATYDYFAPYYNSHRFPKIDNMELDIPFILKELLLRKDEVGVGHLLIEWAATLAHFLHASGLHNLRIELALVAAELAVSYGRFRVAGYLYSDAVAWTLMEHFEQVEQAKENLHIALELAQLCDDKSLEILAKSFLARSNLKEGSISSALAIMESLDDKSCSTAVQKRINLIRAEIALAQEDFGTAYLLYESANEPNSSFTVSIRIVTCLVKLGYTRKALDSLNIIKSNKTYALSLYRKAVMFFTYAQIDIVNDDVLQAFGHAEEANKLLRRIEISNNRIEGVKQKVTNFLEALSRNLKPSFYLI
jgi:hypothetical protein